MATGSLTGTRTHQNLKDAFAADSMNHRRALPVARDTADYPRMAKEARDEGFEEIAEWLETLARVNTPHAGRVQKVIERPDFETHRRGDGRG